MSAAVCVWVLGAVFCVCWLGALDRDVSECVLAVSGLQGVKSHLHHHMEGHRMQSVMHEAGNNNGMIWESTGNWLLTTRTKPNITKQGHRLYCPQHYPTALNRNSTEINSR